MREITLLRTWISLALYDLLKQLQSLVGQKLTLFDYVANSKGNLLEVQTWKYVIYWSFI